jgi:hypothetical protein
MAIYLGRIHGITVDAVSVGAGTGIAINPSLMPGLNDLGRTGKP